jgi:hypothetical protein
LKNSLEYKDKLRNGVIKGPNKSMINDSILGGLGASFADYRS